MLLLVVASVLLCGIHGLPGTSSEKLDVAPRIINGTEAVLGQFPYMVSLRYGSGGVHRCGGTIIKPTWILTAAHCIAHFKPDAVVTGTLRKSNPDGQTYRVVKVIPHEQYPAPYPELKYDIGLIQVDRPITFSKLVGLVGLGSVCVNEEVTVVGWGKGSGDTLTYLPMKTVLQKCPVDLQTQICVKAPNGGACNGDSGGPLVKGKEVVGIASFAQSFTCDSPLPSVYTKVEPYRKWIDSHTKN